MFDEILMSFRSRDLWLYMGWKDVQLRFRRSRIGPLWIILNTSFFIVFMSALWSTIFKMDIKDYLIYFAIGHILWTYFSGVINESLSVFTEFEHVIKQIRLPFYVFPLRVVVRNTIIFFMNMSIVFVMSGLVGVVSVIAILQFTVAIIFFLLVLVGASLVVSIAACRFKDIAQVVPNLLLVIFFCTPIMWKREVLSVEKRWIADFNPFSLIFDSIRFPLMGGLISEMTWVWLALISITTFMFGFVVFQKNINNIARWA